VLQNYEFRVQPAPPNALRWSRLSGKDVSHCGSKPGRRLRLEAERVEDLFDPPGGGGGVWGAVGGAGLGWGLRRGIGRRLRKLREDDVEGKWPASLAKSRDRKG